MAKKKTRVSGYGLDREQNYTKRVDDGYFEVRISDIKKEIDRYLSSAEASGKYSVAGLCIELQITREVLDAWRSGYFEPEDLLDDLVERNDELANCIEMGVLYVERYWEECDKSSVQSKHVKMLERSGAFEAKKTLNIGTPPFDLGSLHKFGK